jgi:hypothetical protein
MIVDINLQLLHCEGRGYFLHFVRKKGLDAAGELWSALSYLETFQMSFAELFILSSFIFSTHFSKRNPKFHICGFYVDILCGVLWFFSSVLSQVVVLNVYSLFRW